MKDGTIGRRLFPLVPVLLVGATIFFSGLNWGLPSRRVDPFLFGNHPIWSGKQILSLLPVDENPDRPADVTAQILGDRSKPILLNATNADRARIIRRYRLFSYQPDEITTFMGLSRMNPRRLDFDPRMYQYGGLWFYPVGALLKICSVVHLVDLRSDPAFYLDHPEQFAKFYIVDRSFTACWAILGIIVAFALVGRLGGDEFEQCVAALGFIFLPVVIYTAHEAKPHLPGAVLALLAILMGVRFMQTQRRRYGIAMSLCCGLAMSMVLTNLPLLILIPIVYAINDWRARALRRSIFGIVGAILVYLLLNPYIAIDFIWHRARLSASFANSAVMYHFSVLGAVGNAIGLIIAGVSLPVFLLGVVGSIVFALRRQKGILVLIAAGLLTAGPYFLCAGGKPAEYGRFALLPDLVFMLLSVRLLGGLPGALRLGTMVAMLAVMAASGLAYWRGYLLDPQSNNTRMQLANDLVKWADGKNVSVAMSAEPAPYSAPPMNLFDWQWVLLPRGENVGSELPYDFSMATVDTAPTPMSWADKQFAVYRGAEMKQQVGRLIFLLGMWLLVSSCSRRTGQIDVRRYGAAGDGKHLDTDAINKAIDAASEAGGGTVIFPAGDYLTFSIHLRSNVALYLDAGAVIDAATPSNGSGYDAPEPNVAGVPDLLHEYQDFGHSHWHNSLIWGENLQNVSILGPGKIYGRGLAHNQPAATQPASRNATDIPQNDSADASANYDGVGNKAISLKNCRNVILRDFTIQHGGWFGILATGVDNLTIDNLKIDTNRDGMDIDACQNVRIFNCTVNSPHDDGICLKSSFALGYARVTKNVTITNCQVSGYVEGSLLDGTYRRDPKSRPTGRIKFGTESNGGFENIAISNCVFDYCCGLALETVDGATLEDISISNITMRDIANAPIFIRLGSRMRGPAGTEMGTCQRIDISNLTVFKADPRQCCLISGVPGYNIDQLHLSNIHLYFRGGGTRRQATSRPAENEHKYPEPSMFGDMPAYGFYIRHATNVEIDHVVLTTLTPDARPPFVLSDLDHVEFDHIQATRAPGVPIVRMRDVHDFHDDFGKR